MKLIAAVLAVALAYTVTAATPSRTYVPAVSTDAAYVIPDYLETPPLPYGYFAASASMLVDATGTVFAVATTNGSPKGGVYVFQLVNGSWTEVVAPGGPLAYSGGEMQIGVDGNLYLSASDEVKGALRQWKVPGWVR